MIFLQNNAMQLSFKWMLTIFPTKHFGVTFGTNIGMEIIDSDDPVERGREIRSIIEMAGRFDELAKVDRKRHIVSPAVESTETWCIAAFRRIEVDPELLKGQELCDEFMAVLHRSENRPVQVFVRIDKSTDRRLRFCRTHSLGFRRLERQCRHFRELVNRVHQA